MPNKAHGPTTQTKLKIMLAAERLFGDFGIEAVALRTVSEVAGQKNTNSVQYHFGDKSDLLQAIFEFREGQLEPARAAMLAQAVQQQRVADIHWLLRICFEPNFTLYSEQNEIAYLKLHAAYLSSHRPRGVPHPVDRDDPSTVSFRHAIALLRKRLEFIDPDRFDLRLESVGSMFLSCVIQHSARDPSTRPPTDVLFEDTLEMMVAAMCAPPWPRGMAAR